MRPEDSMKILIADDERTIREGLCKAIDWRSQGFQEVLEASDGKEACQIIKTRRPDVVLLDIRMPEMTGLEVLAAFQEEENTPGFILLSGYGEFDYAREALRLGALDYLLKPCSMEEVIRSVLKAVKGKRDSLPADKNYYHQAILSAGPKGQKYSPAVEQALNYMLAHLADQDLSLTKVAREELFLHPDYFGKLFKKEVGDKFLTVLMNMRISYATKIIDSSKEHLKISALAGMVGLGNNVAYFSQVFKKAYGVLPSRYEK